MADLIDITPTEINLPCHNYYLLNFMRKWKESPHCISNAEGKTRLFNVIVLNQARIIHTSVERNVYCKGAKA